MADAFIESGEEIECIDKHAWFRLKCQWNVDVLCVSQKGPQTLCQAIQARV